MAQSFYFFLEFHMTLNVLMGYNLNAHSLSLSHLLLAPLTDTQVLGHSDGQRLYVCLRGYAVAQQPKPHQGLLRYVLGPVLVTEESPSDVLQAGAKLMGNMFKCLSGHADLYTHEVCGC